MKVMLWKFAASFVGAFVGMTMVFHALEKSLLVDLANSRTGQDESMPFSMLVLMFVGLVLLAMSVFYALNEWAEYLRRNPNTQQLATWALVAPLILAVMFFVVGMTNHTAWLQSLDVIPDNVAYGYILYQVLMGMLALIPLVLIGVQFTPLQRRLRKERKAGK